MSSRTGTTVTAVSGGSATAATSAVLAVRGALVSAARAGRTVSAGEVSSAAFGALVPRGLARVLDEVTRGCLARDEPDLACLVRSAHPTDDDGCSGGDALAAQRRACWERWGAHASPRSSSVAFGEQGVVCPACLVVAGPEGCRRCPAS